MPVMRTDSWTMQRRNVSDDVYGKRNRRFKILRLRQTSVCLEQQYVPQGRLLLQRYQQQLERDYGIF